MIESNLQKLVPFIIFLTSHSFYLISCERTLLYVLDEIKRRERNFPCMKYTLILFMLFYIQKSTFLKGTLRYF